MHELALDPLVAQSVPAAAGTLPPATRLWAWRLDAARLRSHVIDQWGAVLHRLNHFFFKAVPKLIRHELKVSWELVSAKDHWCATRGGGGT